MDIGFWPHRRISRQAASLLARPSRLGIMPPNLDCRVHKARPKTTKTFLSKDEQETIMCSKLGSISPFPRPAAVPARFFG